MEVWVEQLDRDGWATLSAQFNADEVEVIQAELAEAWRANAAHGRGGVRNLLRTHATVRRLAQEGPMRRAAAAVLGPSCGAVRALLFDKTPGANWKVIWHQDLTIAVAARTADEGYGPWSAKEGVVHTQPPVEVLERMVAVRLHLDPCTRRNGPVRVLPGTHRQGRMTTEVIDRCRAEVPEVVCEAALGGAAAVSPTAASCVVARRGASSPSGAPRGVRPRHAARHNAMGYVGRVGAHPICLTRRCTRRARPSSRRPALRPAAGRLAPPMVGVQFAAEG